MSTPTIPPYAETAFIAGIVGDVITPSHPSYADSLIRWAANSQRPARYVVFVKSPEDVALSIAFARIHKLELAVRGGGHNPSGASSIDGGLVIDLSKYLNTVRVDEEKKLAYVGGGAVWRDVDCEAIKYGLATVGGTVNHVGSLSPRSDSVVTLSAYRPESAGLRLVEASAGSAVAMD